jgi:hypothetical protein
VGKLKVFGIAVSVFALAAAGAGAMGGGRLAPEASPYALLEESFTAPRYEGRSVAIGEFYQPAAREQMGRKRQSRHSRHSMSQGSAFRLKAPASMSMAGRTSASGSPDIP